VPDAKTLKHRVFALIATAEERLDGEFSVVRRESSHQPAQWIMHRSGRRGGGWENFRLHLLGFYLGRQRELPDEFPVGALHKDANRPPQDGGPGHV
jgi:hypothetical protein